MISYAQNLEDVLIERFFRGDAPQTYIDVGAAHPSYHSVTKHFYNSRWTGINIEPRSHFFEKLSVERPRDHNLNCAISDTAGQLTFYEVTCPDFPGADTGGLSTLDAERADDYCRQGFEVQAKQVPIRTLSQILEEKAWQEIGFLKIDVEGFELQVVRGLDLGRWRPRLVVAESTLPTTDIVCDDDVQQHLQSSGYVAAAYDGLNRFYIREEDRERLPRLQAPANVTDGYVLAEQIELRSQIDVLNSQIELLLQSTKELRAQNKALLEICSPASAAYQLKN